MKFCEMEKLSITKQQGYKERKKENKKTEQWLNEINN